jgi:HPt (histidine-containing phosphotransfer) domain-containing protein
LLGQIILDFASKWQPIPMMPIPDPPPVLDRAEGLRRVRGNETLYRELMQVFLNDLPRLTALLRTALENASANDLHYAAHSLKGSASHLGALAIAQDAWIFEKMGRDGDLAGAMDHFRVFEQDLHRLIPVLQSLTSDAPPK